MTYDPWGLPASPPPDKDPWGPVPPPQGGPGGPSVPGGQGGQPGHIGYPGRSGFGQPAPPSDPGVTQNVWSAHQPMGRPGGAPGQPGPLGPPGRLDPPGAKQQPALTLTVVVTLLAGIFGLVPAALHSSQAKQDRLDGSRYWKAFGVIFGTQTAVLVILAVAIPGLLGSVLEGFGGGRASSAAEPTIETYAPAPTEQASLPGPVATTPEPTPTPRERTGREEPNRTPDVVTVQSSSSGSACSATSRQSSWGSYPVGECRTWKPSTGLISGASLSTGTIAITCQADLRESNPIYTANQTNTWWFWAQADNGTWDWFPETALAQGASNQSVNGVALCR